MTRHLMTGTAILPDALAGICTLDDLRTFVHLTLCRQENLLADQFAMTEMPLRRRGQLCGLQFAVHGPRSVRLGAVWAADRNVLYCYDARGERFLKLPLPQRVTLPEPAEQCA